MKGYVGLRGRYYGGMSAVHGLSATLALFFASSSFSAFSAFLFERSLILPVSRVGVVAQKGLKRKEMSRKSRTTHHFFS
jgi:hypothetical protein